MTDETPIPADTEATMEELWASALGVAAPPPPQKSGEECGCGYEIIGGYVCYVSGAGCKWHGVRSNYGLKKLNQTPTRGIRYNGQNRHSD